MNKILYEDNHLLVAVKKNNQIVQEDITKDKDLLSELKAYIKEKYNKPGNVYLGLVHRLDRPVGGVMVFARTSKAAERLSKQIQKNDMNKYYLAVVCGKLDNKKGTMEDRLLKIEKENKTIVSEKGKDSKLEYEVLEEKDDLSLVRIHLITGRSHQIRVQFASRNVPLWGDNKYNTKAVAGEQIALWAYKLEFEHPVNHDKLIFKELPNKDIYPWNQFSYKNL